MAPSSAEEAAYKFMLINGRKTMVVHRQFVGMLKAAIEARQARRILNVLCSALLLQQAWSAGRNAPSGASSSCENLLLEEEDTRNGCPCCGLLIYGLTNGLCSLNGLLVSAFGSCQLQLQTFTLQPERFPLLLLIHSEFPAGRKKTNSSIFFRIIPFAG